MLGWSWRAPAAAEDLEWCGLFALALVRVGRHLEVKAINKAWMLDSARFGLLGSGFDGEDSAA